MTSIIFEISGKKYQYVVCNFNFNINNIQLNFNKIIKEENIKLESGSKVGIGNKVRMRTTFSSENNIVQHSVTNNFCCRKN